MDAEILRIGKEYFDERIAKFGANHSGVDWNSRESQEKRFEQLIRLLPPNCGKENLPFSLLDYGCGYGAFMRYLDARGISLSYTGQDISQKMLDAAAAYLKDMPKAELKLGANIDGEYDYIVESGIFNMKRDMPDEKWLDYVLEVLESFNGHARRGFAFNILTKYSDAEYMRADLYYADPLFLFDYCKRHFSRNVALLHDYGVYEFTMLVRK